MLGYFSGYLGYLVLAHYIRVPLTWGRSLRLWVGFLLMLVGAVATIDVYKRQILRKASSKTKAARKPLCQENRDYFLPFFATKPFSFDPYRKCLTVVALVSVRKIAKHLQRHLNGVVPFGVQLFPYSQCSVVYSAVYRMVGMRADGCLQVLCHTCLLYTSRSLAPAVQH